MVSFLVSSSLEIECVCTFHPSTRYMHDDEYQITEWEAKLICTYLKTDLG